MTDAAIHDLGYQRYAGRRGGAVEARRALFVQGLRAMFGLGRSAKAKIVPVFVLVVTMLPALANLAAASAAQGQLPVRYGVVIGAQLMLFVLFAAAQTPELLSRDQQHQLLPLLLTREVSRAGYAVTRLLAVFCSMLLVALAPLLLLYVGEIGIAADPAAAFRTMGDRIGPVLLFGTTTAWVFATLGAALASLTARRAYATAGVIGLLLVAGAVAGGLEDLAGVSPKITALLDPIRALRTLALVLFGETTRAMELKPPPSVAAHLLSLGTFGAVACAVYWQRIRRLRV